MLHIDIPLVKLEVAAEFSLSLAHGGPICFLQGIDAFAPGVAGLGFCGPINFMRGAARDFPAYARAHWQGFMSSFKKGALFTMGGEEYEVLTEGTSDPASCLVYAPAHGDGHDPMEIRLWKAEAKLARGDILMSGQSAEEDAAAGGDENDPAESIAELQRRIRAIERRRVIMRKPADPAGAVLLNDNVVRPNKPFEIWNYARREGRPGRNIQFIKIRSIIICLSAGDRSERFLFNVAPGQMPNCRNAAGILASEGKVSLELCKDLRTVDGKRPEIPAFDMEWRVGLLVGLHLGCKASTGNALAGAHILQASFIRDVRAQGLILDQPAPPTLGGCALAIEGVGLDIYTDCAGS